MLLCCVCCCGNIKMCWLGVLCSRFIVCFCCYFVVVFCLCCLCLFGFNVDCFCFFMEICYVVV